MAAGSVCSFCGKSRSEVDHIVAGPRRVGICNECVELAYSVATPAATPAEGELVLTGIGELVTNDPQRSGLLGVMRDAAVVIRDRRVVWVGEGTDVPTRYTGLPEFPCEGRAVIPGFVDSHTHLVFAGNRAVEFSMRLAGASYEEIAQAGGGIVSTVAATRAATADDLLAGGLERAGLMLSQGTTTVEIKSGYGLETNAEAAMLAVGRELGQRLPIDTVTTFLGAHAVPSEWREDRSGYVDLVVKEMLPRCAPLATYCDVFCDRGAFSVEEAEAVFSAGRRLGLKPRVHANQLGATGGVELAIRIGAVSADHVDHVDSEQALALAQAGVVATLVPVASMMLGGSPPPGRLLWQSGAVVALATDCNPGTAYVTNMQFVIALAVLEMGLTQEQALWSATRGGALALEGPDKGRLSRGAAGDLVVLEADSYRHLGYRPDANLVRTVVKGGDVVLG